jgi:hypothetical protein
MPLWGWLLGPDAYKKELAKSDEISKRVDAKHDLAEFMRTK